MSPTVIESSHDARANGEADPGVGTRRLERVTLATLESGAEPFRHW
jgi:hypothetical protein